MASLLVALLRISCHSITHLGGGRSDYSARWAQEYSQRTRHAGVGGSCSAGLVIGTTRSFDLLNIRHDPIWLQSGVGKDARKIQRWFSCESPVLLRAHFDLFESLRIVGTRRRESVHQLVYAYILVDVADAERCQRSFRCQTSFPAKWVVCRVFPPKSTRIDYRLPKSAGVLKVKLATPSETFVGVSF